MLGGGKPLSLDFATSIVANGKLQVAANPAGRAGRGGPGARHHMIDPYSMIRLAQLEWFCNFLEMFIL